MPAQVHLELTALWHRETELVGAYTYCSERWPTASGRRRSAWPWSWPPQVDLGALVSARYPLDRYVDAIRHAANAGSRQSVKVCFDLRGERHRP